MKSTVVPFRNGIMLAIGCGMAESRGLNRVLIANHFGDHSIYPDCREEFIRPMSEAMRNGTYAGVEIEAPYTKISKADICRIGTRLGIDYSKTYSCYKGGEKHCGKCGTCRERKEAFRLAVSMIRPNTRSKFSLSHIPMCYGELADSDTRDERIIYVIRVISYGELADRDFYGNKIIYIIFI